MLTRFILMIVFGLVSGQEFCCSPDQWEAAIGFVQGIATPGDPTVNTGFDFLHYDFSNKKFAVRTSLTSGSGEPPKKIIRDYNTRIQYIIDLDTGFCKRGELSSSMPRACPADGSVKFPPVTLGAGPDLSTVNAYVRTTPGVVNSFVFTEVLCVPFTNTIWGDITGTGVQSMQVFAWQNLTLGIKDPSVFDIPSSCNTDMRKGEYQGKLSQCMEFALGLY